MRNLSEITSEEWAELVVFINTTVYGKTKYPHPGGLVSYNEEVIASLRHIKDGIAEKLRPSKLAPVLSEEFMPFFVVKWLKERGFLNELKERQCTIPRVICCGVLEKMNLGWMKLEDGTKCMPHIKGHSDDNKYRVNNCPSCGKYVRDVMV